MAQERFPGVAKWLEGGNCLAYGMSHLLKFRGINGSEL